MAANRAYVNDCNTLVVGVSQQDFGGYPDCRHDFIAKMTAALASGLDRPFKIEAPLMNRTKAETVELAGVLPGCMEALAYSTTCYNGSFPPCQECNSCLLRQKGFAEANVRDPLLLRVFGRDCTMTKIHQNIHAVRRLQFCAGHRVYKHESKCANVHGHNYVVFLHARAKVDSKLVRSVGAGLDELGRVIDFAVLKERFAPWIEANWDHGFIVWKNDKEAIAALSQISEQKIYLLEANPTAENMALHLLRVVAPAVLEGSAVELAKVVLWETENCFVEVGEL